ncbi:MAG: membrane protein of unknown function [Promethearchaeota archaeon]|nr:MAG: membrane protein of unknown function [Candidatus Lokiarchaeota archaeon]
MEAGTHALVGVLIQILCFRFFIFPLNIIFTIILGFISHFIVDGLAKITYHTPEPRMEDKFWVIWHIVIFGFSIFTIIWFLIPYWLGELSANLVDIWDWLILRNYENWKKKRDPDFKFKHNYYIHHYIDKFREKLFCWLPNWNYEKKGIIPEILIIFLLLTFIIFMLN